ncbi:hypothetical protein DICPUDRAFT_95683 [Dictyostelium purpureum]|uniref:PPM-type phosphatase domain-containing protein n=1 Tax=Dictyostelium purpureum TaxID=5786 RepID=F0ZZA6_DICPU|nr:uncharacterized protein DICPUDRAFT_95683 [Dictyostelium purpureum]EGC30715.1 hypothetical protein DICPUDRAFT_95683 [Dictyostelium purpureum]|eukprot:XP_003292750.1 hypothetical protein DICPUDRAFT_95683 [Dictyostelium purpureum]
MNTSESNTDLEKITNLENNTDIKLNEIEEEDENAGDEEIEIDEDEENKNNIETEPPKFIGQLRVSSPKFNDTLINSNSGRVQQNEKKQLSRTITFADPSSIQSFFGNNVDVGVSNNNNNNNSNSNIGNNFTTSLAANNSNNNNILSSTSSPLIKIDPKHKISEKNRTSSKISLSTIFPKLQFNQQQTPTLSPSKYYYPLLQPSELTTLIRGYHGVADINKKGLKRAKKSMEMEDEYLCLSPFGNEDQQMSLFAIFDGHSGKNVAVSAKQIFPSILLKYIDSAKREMGGRPIYDMRGVFLSAFKEVDAQLSKYEYEGSTATICLVWKAGHQRFVQSANVGDSTAFLSYGAETLFLSKDHRLTDPEEITRIKADGIQLTEGQTRINGLMVSRALGDHFIKHLNCGLIGEPYVSPPISITPFHSYLIVASDGLWDVISGHRAMEIIKSQQSEEKMANNLLQCAVGSIKSKDNISIIVVTLQ